MAVDITINETIDSVDITVNPNIIEVNVTRTSGGGGGAYLPLAGGTMDAEAIIAFDNGSELREGTYNFGGSGGISRICSVGFEDMWQSGIRHVFDNNGLIRHSTNCFAIVPDSSFDNTLRFKVDSLWTLDSGVTYKCTDATTGAAVWELYNTDVPTLQQVTDEGNTTTNDVIVEQSATIKTTVLANVDEASVVAEFDGNLAYILSGATSSAIGTVDTNGTSELNSGALQILSADYNMLMQQAKLTLASSIDQPYIGMSGINGSVSINTNLLTANRQQEVPDKDGTFAMLDDVTGVPYTGATADVNLGAFDLYTSKQWLYDAPNDNYGSMHFTDGNFHIEDGDGHPMLVLEDEFMQIHKSSTIQSNLWTSLLSAIRDHYLPNESGTLALTSIVADAITDGVTDKAPSQNAVFDVLALKQNNLKTFNTTQGIYYFEEFMGSQAGQQNTNFSGVTSTQSGAGASCITTATITNRTNQQGVVRASTGTTLSGSAGFTYGGQTLFRGTGAITLETYTTIETLSTLLERFYNYFGYVGTGSAINPNNGIFFAYDEAGLLGFGASAASPNWKCVTINSTVRTFTITSIPVVAGQWYKLRININAASNSVEFYIDGVLVATHTTNIPTVATATSITSLITKTIGTTARAIQTDYFMYEEIFTTAR